MMTRALEHEQAPPMKFWIAAIARTGYVARAFLFISIGVLTLLAAFGFGGHEAGFQEVVRALLDNRPGEIAGLILAVGLTCFAVWRFIEACAPTDARPKSVLRRGAFAASGLFYLGLAATTVALSLGSISNNAGGDQAARSWTRWLLGHSYGTVLVTAVGIGFVIEAVVLLVRALNPRFENAIALRPGAPAFIAALGRYGLIARAIVFAEVGGFLIYAALTYNSRQAQGMGGAFRALKSLEYGSILLALTAAGFVAFGLFELGKAFYCNTNPRTIAADP
jgi:hypothetical protein